MRLTISPVVSQAFRIFALLRSRCGSSEKTSFLLCRVEGDSIRSCPDYYLVASESCGSAVLEVTLAWMQVYSSLYWQGHVTG